MLKFLKSLVGLALVLSISSCKLVEVVPTANAPEDKNKISIKSSEKKETIKIGTISPLGKETGYLGKSLVNAIELAIEKSNQLQDFPINLLMVHEDGKCDEKTSEEKANELIKTHNVQAIIGGLCSQESKGIAKITNDAKVPFISLYALSQDRETTNNFTFYLTPTDKTQAEKAAEFAFKDLHQKKLVIISEKSNYGQNLEAAFSYKFEELGGKIEEKLNIERDKKDFETVSGFLETVNFDGLYVVSMPENIKILFENIEKIGKPITIIGSDTLNSEELIKNFTFKNLRLIVLSLASNDNSNWHDFYYEYQLKYGLEPAFGAAEGYDSINLIIEIIKKNGYDKTMITAGLKNLKPYQGVSGKIKFENQENILKDWEILELGEGNQLNKLK